MFFDEADFGFYALENLAALDNISGGTLTTFSPCPEWPGPYLSVG
jgi:hypothetical protein